MSKQDTHVNKRFVASGSVNNAFKKRVNESAVKIEPSPGMFATYMTAPYPETTKNHDAHHCQ